MTKALAVTCLVAMLLVSVFAIYSMDASNAADSEFPKDMPFLYIDPEVVTAGVNEEITFSVKIFNLTNNVDSSGYYPLGNLRGIDLKVKWDPNVLECISRTVTIPVEDYLGGVLYAPILWVKDVLNNTEGTYRLVCASQNTTISFNNPGQSNTIVILKFRVKLEGSSTVELVPVDPSCTPQRPAKLTGKMPTENIIRLIPYYYRGARFEIAGSPTPKFTVYPVDGYVVVNKTVTFNASESQPGPFGTRIVGYKWDFGDGNITDWLTSPIVNYIYTHAGTRYVKLQVKDDSERTSSWTEPKKIIVVNKRDVSVLLITFPATRSAWGETITFNVTVGNEGEAPENVTVSAYYNSTSDGGWIYIGSKNVTVRTGEQLPVIFYWNTSLLPYENAYYRILANVTTVPHEHTLTNNEKISAPIELLKEPFHDIAIISVSGKAYAAGVDYGLPAIIGENIKITFTVKVLGTFDETFNVTLQIFFSNGTLWKTKEWTNETLKRLAVKTFEWIIPATIADNLNATIQIVLANDTWQEDNFKAYSIRIIAPPVLQISYHAENLYTEEDITFNATASIHPSGIIGSYTWERKRKEEDVAKYRDRKVGPVVKYRFETPGNWTVRLRVVDNWGVTYMPERPATAAYQKEIVIQVSAPPGPPYHIYGLAALVVIIAVAAIMLWRMKARK